MREIHPGLKVMGDVLVVGEFPPMVVGEGVESRLMGCEGVYDRLAEPRRRFSGRPER